MLLGLIDTIHKAASLPVYSYGTTRVEDCVLYEYTCISDNGAVAQDKLTLHVIARDPQACKEASWKIMHALVTCGDEEKLGAKSIVLNGGGTLKDYTTNTVHEYMYFYITRRSCLYGG